MIASSTLVGLFVSGPFVLISSLMTMLDKNHSVTFIPTISTTSEWLGTVSATLLIWVVLSFMVFPELRASANRVRVVMPLAIFQMLFPIFYITCTSCNTHWTATDPDSRASQRSAWPWALYFWFSSASRLWAIPLARAVSNWPEKEVNCK